MSFNNFVMGCKNADLDIIKQEYEFVRDKDINIYSWGVRYVALNGNREIYDFLMKDININLLNKNHLHDILVGVVENKWMDEIDKIFNLNAVIDKNIQRIHIQVMKAVFLHGDIKTIKGIIDKIGEKYQGEMWNAFDSVAYKRDVESVVKIIEILAKTCEIEKSKNGINIFIKETLENVTGERELKCMQKILDILKENSQKFIVDNLGVRGVVWANQEKWVDIFYEWCDVDELYKSIKKVAKNGEGEYFMKKYESMRDKKYLSENIKKENKIKTIKKI